MAAVHIPDIPRVYHEFWDNWQQHKEKYVGRYQQGKHSFVPGLLPEQAVQLSTQTVLSILRGRLGDALDIALSTQFTDPDIPAYELPAQIQSPVAHHPDSSWLKLSNMVGINVRTVHNFWNIIKYMLTVPDIQDSVHLLPIWEPGVVQSLYGMSSWQINNEFFSEELLEFYPALDTVGKQLKAVINLLHAMGKSVGMDVIPHTDRFSEMALANPHYFEWLQREDLEIIDHSANLHEVVQTHIMDFLVTQGAAVHDETYPSSAKAFFSDDAFAEEKRLRVLFGEPQDREWRNARRSLLVKHLYRYGYEPVPATMGPPYRVISVDIENYTIDGEGLLWRDYLITRPESFSRVFNPLARYKLYERLNDNVDWEIDFDRPRPAVWQYVSKKYHEAQQRFGFDFMRGDMSHVQMRVAGVPEIIDDYYDILRTVKNYIQGQSVPYFGYFAETFLAPRGIMGYGDEVDHLEASDADTTLGDLQSMVVGSIEYIQQLRRYLDLAQTRTCVPNLTVMTGDKDDPRFDEFYVKGNEVRLFMAYFLADMPSYMGLGFRSRDVHYEPVPNEHYTKLFVFQEKTGPKATSGPYIWGKNGALFHRLSHLTLYAESIFPQIRGLPVDWLIPPDATAEQKFIAWTLASTTPEFIFVANLDIDQDVHNFNIPLILGAVKVLECEFSTREIISPSDQILEWQPGLKGYKIHRMFAGEGRVYRRRMNI